MPAYDEEALSVIATSIEIDSGDLVLFACRFEHAALWYRLDCNAAKRTEPSVIIPKLDSIRSHANKLLKSLGVENSGGADDGPSIDILEALVLTTDADSTPVVEATRRLARLREILDAIAAARELSERAEKAAQETARIGELTVYKGHSGDRAVNDWIAAMLVLYKEITGKAPKTSVGKTGRQNEGVATGPLIRFLEAAGAPLGIRFSADAWRSRVRTILNESKREHSK